MKNLKKKQKELSRKHSGSTEQIEQPIKDTTEESIAAGLKIWIVDILREFFRKYLLIYYQELNLNIMKSKFIPYQNCIIKHENLLLVLLIICLWFSVSLWQIYWFFPFLSFLLISTYFYSFLLISTCFYLFLLIYLSYIYLFLPTFNYSYLSLLISTHLFDLFLLVSTYFYLFLLVSIEIIGFSCLHLGSLHPRIFSQVFYSLQGSLAVF